MLFALKFVVTVLMHFSVKDEVAQGLYMMQYVAKHREDFSAPNAAFWAGFMQCWTGIFTECCCVLWLASIGSAIDVIMKYLALTSIANVDNVYAKS